MLDCHGIDPNRADLSGHYLEGRRSAWADVIQGDVLADFVESTGDEVLAAYWLGVLHAATLGRPGDD